MDFASLLHTVLRLIHIVSAFAWFGVALVAALMIGPALVKAGPAALPGLKRVITHPLFNRLYAPAALLTTLAGLLLYGVSRSNIYFTTTGNIVLGIGTLFGLLAFGHGVAAMGRYSTLLEKAFTDHVADDAAPSEAGFTAVQAVAARWASNGRISFYLTLIALIGMSLARYL